MVRRAALESMIGRPAVHSRGPQPRSTVGFQLLPALNRIWERELWMSPACLDHFGTIVNRVNMAAGVDLPKYPGFRAGAIAKPR